MRMKENKNGKGNENQSGNKNDNREEYENDLGDGREEGR